MRFVGGDAHVVEGDLGVTAVVAVVVAEHGQRAHDAHARGVARDQDHGLLTVARGIRVGLAHDDEERGIGVHRAGRPPLAAGDHVVVAVAADARADVRRVRRRDLGLGHAERRADLGVEQRLEPLGLLLGRAEVVQHLHVAGVGRGAVERGRRQARAPPGDLGDGRVLQVRQPARRSRRARCPPTGEEEVPQPLRAGLRPAARAPPGAPSSRSGVGGQLLVEHRLGRQHVLVEERAGALGELERSFVGREVHQRTSSPFCASGSTSAPIRSKPSPTVSPAWIAVVDPLEDHRELVRREGAVPVADPGRRSPRAARRPRRARRTPGSRRRGSTALGTAPADPPGSSAMSQ